MKSRGGWGWFALGSPLIALIVISIVALIVATSPSVLIEQFRSEGFLLAVGVSLRTTTIATIAIVGFGLALAIAARGLPRFAPILEAVVSLPAILPPSVAGLALLMAFGRQGLLGAAFDRAGVSVAFTPIAVVLAQVFVACPFFVREAIAAFQVVDPDIIDAATLDGASTSSLVRFVFVPMSGPILLGGTVLAWARAVGEFGATILFAGNLTGKTQTIPLAIYLGFESDLDQAKALSVVLLGAAVIALMASRWLLGSRTGR